MSTCGPRDVNVIVDQCRRGSAQPLCGRTHAAHFLTAGPVRIANVPMLQSLVPHSSPVQNTVQHGEVNFKLDIRQTFTLDPAQLLSFSFTVDVG